ncbi:MAG: hypothetical protein GX626_00005 [Spirochaetales bacterium]|nr:hypothetical protein [Spirochaetales bacterium]
MKKFLQKLKLSLQQWSYGRYGFDQLSRVLYIISLVCIGLSLIPDFQLLVIAAFAFMVLVTFRTSSKNTTKRRLENDKFLKLIKKPRAWFAFRKEVYANRKTYCYFTCRECGRHYRVPKGKGKIKISCPGCGTTVIAKT